MSTTPPHPVAVDVAVLPWPDDDHLRAKLTREELPRVLVVPDRSPPPEVLDELEDWIREPYSLWDLQLRTDRLRARVYERSLRPRVDDEGLLWAGSNWVAIPPSQAPVVELLVEHYQRVVETHSIVAAYAAAGGSDRPTAIKAVMARIAHRVEPVGLELHAVRARGYLLERRARQKALR